MDKTIGMIGCGNMGKAMVEGMMKAQLVKEDQLIVSNLHPEKLQELGNRYDFYISDNETVARHADILILAVKPHLYAPIIDEIKELIKSEVILIDIAPGITIQDMTKMVGRACKVVKAMPNTPALVGEGMSAISFGSGISDDEQEEIMELFESFGKAQVVEERLMDAVAAVSGSAPAYIFLVIEAMADGAVRHGIPRQAAYQFAAQTLIGSAKLVQETGMHPGECKDMVCSPGGTTIEAIAKLEEKGLRSAIIEAMDACVKKSRAMKQS